MTCAVDRMFNYNNKKVKTYVNQLPPLFLQVPATSQTCTRLCAVPPPLFPATRSPYGFKTQKRLWQTGSRCTLPSRGVILGAWWWGGGGPPPSRSTPPCPPRVVSHRREVVAAIRIITRTALSPSGTAFWRREVVWEVSVWVSCILHGYY